MPNETDSAADDEDDADAAPNDGSTLGSIESRNVLARDNLGLAGGGSCSAATTAAGRLAVAEAVAAASPASDSTEPVRRFSFFFSLCSLCALLPLLCACLIAFL